MNYFLQIALLKLLDAVSIQADGFIGHSFGELGCALADGCLTDEQMLLAAYYRGVAITTFKSIDGSMASIGK